MGSDCFAKNWIFQTEKRQNCVKNFPKKKFAFSEKNYRSEHQKKSHNFPRFASKKKEEKNLNLNNSCIAFAANDRHTFPNVGQNLIQNLVIFE